ncbi:2-methoxy-6-polyprenyl-1,4-benzoquinol methylase, mitochondrial [subsurface metagenome]
MEKEKKLKRVPDIVYKIDIWFFKFFDLLSNPRRLLKNIPLKEGMTVVDYGCGIGRYTLPVAELIGLKGKVFGVDIQPLAIKTVKEKAAKHGLTNVEAILVDSYNTGIQDSSVDIVLLIDTLHLIEDCNALFQEIYRILKQDGVIFMDKGHLKMSRAREIVESTELFTIVECWSRDMLFAPKDKR